MLKKLALSLSESGKNNYEVNLYLLRSFIHMAATLISLLVLAYILGIFKWTLIAVLTSMILRWFSGGGHSRSKITCSVLTLIIPISFAYLTEYLTKLNISEMLLAYSSIIFIIGIIIIHKYAPADTPQKPIVSVEFKSQLKRKSYIFLFLIKLVIIGLYLSEYIYFTQITLSLILGLSWQLFTVTPYGYRFIKVIDSLVQFD